MLVEEVFGQGPSSERLFVFCNRRRFPSKRSGVGTGVPRVPDGCLMHCSYFRSSFLRNPWLNTAERRARRLLDTLLFSRFFISLCFVLAARSAA